VNDCDSIAFTAINFVFEREAEFESSLAISASSLIILEFKDFRSSLSFANSSFFLSNAPLSELPHEAAIVVITNKRIIVLGLFF
jgi:hypothetical protein